MKKHIVCLGDSNTYGLCADPAGCTDGVYGRFNEEERWICLLQKALGDKYFVIEEGLSGRTTVFPDPLHEGMAAIDYIEPCMKSHGPISLLVIMLGTNDVKDRFAASPTCVALGIERLIRKAKSIDCWENENPCNILVISPPPIGIGMLESPARGTMGTGCVEKSEQLGPLMRTAAQNTGCQF